MAVYRFEGVPSGFGVHYNYKNLSLDDYLLPSM